MELAPIVNNPLTDSAVRDMNYYRQLEWDVAEREAGMAWREVELGEVEELGAGEAAAGMYELDAAGIIPMGLNPLLDISECDPKAQQKQELVDNFNNVQQAIMDTYHNQYVWYMLSGYWYRGLSTITKWLSIQNPFTILSIAVDWWDPETQSMFTRTYKMVNPFNGKNEVQPIKTFTPPPEYVGMLKPGIDPTTEYTIPAKKILKARPLLENGHPRRVTGTPGRRGGPDQQHVGPRRQDVPDPLQDPSR